MRYSQTVLFLGFTRKKKVSVLLLRRTSKIKWCISHKTAVCTKSRGNGRGYRQSLWKKNCLGASHPRKQQRSLYLMSRKEQIRRWTKNSTAFAYLARKMATRNSRTKKRRAWHEKERHYSWFKSVLFQFQQNAWKRQQLVLILSWMLFLYHYKKPRKTHIFWLLITF